MHRISFAPRLLRMLFIPALLLPGSGCVDAAEAPADAGPDQTVAPPSGLPPLRDGGLPKEQVDAGAQAPGSGTRPDAGTWVPPARGGATDDAGSPEPVAPADAGPRPAVCGNGQVEEGEVCDGELRAGIDCRDLGFSAGALACKPSCLAYETAACTPLAETPIPAPGTELSLAGSLLPDAPTWQRPSEQCAAALPTRHFFAAFALVNDTDVLQTIDVEAEFEGNGFLAIYDDTFAPRDPTLGCLDANDDAAGQLARSASSDLPMAPGEVRILVATTSAPNVTLASFSLRVATRSQAGICGNGVREPGEVCDGLDLGGDSCNTRGFSSGTLRCAPDCLSFAELDCVPEEPAAELPIASPGDAVTIRGTIGESEPTWARREADCTAAVRDGQRYRAHRIVNQTGASQYLRITAAWENDGYLFVYRAPFVADAPETGCLAGDDDFGGLLGSQIEDVAIEPDEVLVVIASGYAPDDVLGPYTIEVLTQTPAVCGDGIRTQEERCDGVDLELQSCFTQGFSGGTLTCAEDCSAFSFRDCYELPDVIDIADPGNAVALTGALEPSDPRFVAPTASCDAGAEPVSHFDVYRIRNTSASRQVIALSATFGTESTLHVYGTGFSSTLPTLSCRRPAALPAAPPSASDDASLRWSIEAGETLLVVASSPTPQQVGAYTVEVVTDDIGETDEVRAIGPPGVSIQLSGSLDASDPTWNRPAQDCTIEDNEGRYFDVHRIVNQRDRTEDLTITANWQSGDGFIHLLTRFYDFENPDAFECLGGNDDFGAQQRLNGSQLVSSVDSSTHNIFILPGEELWVVASAFAAEDPIGAYTIEVRTGATDAEPPVAASLTAGGQLLRSSGTLHVTDPRWTLPAYCGGPEPELSGRPFDAHFIRNDSGAVQDLRVTARWNNGAGHLGVYLDEAFNPDTPGLCLTGENRASEAGTWQVNEFILAGETLSLVATSTDLPPVGAYSLEIETLP